MLTYGRALALAFLAILAMTPGIKASYLNPAAFPSSGVLTLAAGNYTIDTNGAPTLRDASNTVLFTGTTHFQGGTFGDTISVLTFDSISIGVGANIRVSGSNPFALLSKSNIVMSGLINASGFKGTDSGRFGGDGAGGAGGPGAGKGGNGGGFPGFTGGGPGGGPGGPGGIGAVQAAGGSFGGLGGVNALGQVGSVYGNLNLLLQGGSGGGGTGGSFFDGVGAGGGGGGGAVELGALGTIDFVNGGDLISNGGAVGAAFAANAGGGSGGGLLIHAPNINVAGATDILAQGGDFFGGGGRILFLTTTGTINQTGGNINAGAGGGANNQQNGVVEYGRLQAVPEPATITLFALGGLATAAVSYRRRRQG